MLVALSFFLMSSAHAQSINRNITMYVWEDSRPPTSGDSDFYEKVSENLKTLDSNLKIIKKIAKRKGKKLVSKKSSRKQFYDLMRKHGIPKSYFFDAEKAQIILLINMVTNNSIVTGKYNRRKTLQASETMLLFAKKRTSVLRRRWKNRNQIDVRQALLALGAAYIVSSAIGEMTSAVKHGVIPIAPYKDSYANGFTKS